MYKSYFFSHAFTLDHQNQARQILELLYLLKVYNKTKHLKHKDSFDKNWYLLITKNDLGTGGQKNNHTIPWHGWWDFSQEGT